MLDISLEHNYQFDVWEKSAATGQKQLNISEQQLPLYDEIDVTERVKQLSSRLIIKFKDGYMYTEY